MRKMIKQQRREKAASGTPPNDFEIQIISNQPPDRQLVPTIDSSGNSTGKSMNRNSKERQSIPVGKLGGDMEEMKEEIRRSGSREHEAEILRMQLENELGFAKFFTVYKQIKSDMEHGSFEMQYLSMYLPSSKLRMGPVLMKLLLLEQAD